MHLIKTIGILLVSAAWVGYGWRTDDAIKLTQSGLRSLGRRPKQMAKADSAQASVKGLATLLFTMRSTLASQSFRSGLLSKPLIAKGRLTLFEHDRSSAPHRSSAVMSESGTQNRVQVKQILNAKDVQQIADQLGNNFFDQPLNFFQGGIKKRWVKQMDSLYIGTVGSPTIDPPFALLIAKDDNNKLIGSAWLLAGACNKTAQTLYSVESRFESVPEDEEVALLQLLVVNKEQRGQGLAKELVAVAERQAKEWGYPELFLLVDPENIPAVNLYRSSGYEELFLTGVNTFGPEGNKKVQASCMSKRLVTDPVSSVSDDLGKGLEALGDLFSNFFR